MNSKPGKVVPESRASCKVCIRLIKTITPGQVQLLPRGDGGYGPLLPIVYSFPHVCSFDMLAAVQLLRNWKWMGKGLFDRWMALNGGQYQLGVNNALLSLWHLRLEAIDTYSWPEARKDPISTSLQRYKCERHVRDHIKVLEAGSTIRENIKELNWWYPFSNIVDKQKTNVDLASVVTYACRAGMRDRVNLALRLLAVGLPNITATCSVVHAMGNPVFAKMYAMVLKDGACCMSLEGYSKYYKHISTAIRRTSRHYNGTSASLQDITGMAFWDICTGRAGYIANWKEEERKRTSTVAYLKMPYVQGSVGVATNSEYLRALRVELNIIFEQLIKPSDTWGSWYEHVMDRQTWVSSGSAGGAKLEVDGKNIRMNKHSYFETLTKEEMISWLDTEPIIEAVASDKKEMGKPRAIYGTTPINYCIMTYSMADIEKKLSRVTGIEGGLNGIDEVSAIIRRSLIVKDPLVECTMIDYADFNFQHTLAAQSLLFTAQKDRMVAIYAHKDVIKATEWCEAAMLNQVCRFPGSDEMKQIKQGMYSGVRGTNYINTILNLAYFRLGARSVSQDLGLEPVGLYNIHQGDDVWITNYSRLWAIALYNTMCASGFEFQASKQLFDVSFGEFLRVVYNAEGARGYIARALGAFVMRPVQNVDELDASEKSKGLDSQIKILYRRGLTKEACDVLWLAGVKHALSIRMPGGGGFTIPSGIAKASYLDGGLDLGPPCTMAVRRPPTAPMPTMATSSKRIASVLPTHMTDDWLVRVSERVRRPINYKAVATMLHDMNAMDSIQSQDRMMGLRRLERQMKPWLSHLDNVVSSRTEKEYLSWFKETETCYDILKIVRLIRDPRCPKVSGLRRGMIETMLAAISTSPFRDLATAMKGLGLSTIPAARIAMSLAKSSKLANEAVGLTFMVSAKCSDLVLGRILSGLRGAGSAFESILNPIILSWLTHYGTELALRQALYDQIKTSTAWDIMLDYFVNLVIHTAVSDGTLLHISHY
nr:RNA-dependent RNA polymerase [Totiviridae sp.]